jgi:hypothetical protein
MLFRPEAIAGGDGDEAEAHDEVNDAGWVHGYPRLGKHGV